MIDDLFGGGAGGDAALGAGGLDLFVPAPSSLLVPPERREAAEAAIIAEAGMLPNPKDCDAKSPGTAAALAQLERIARGGASRGGSGGGGGIGARLC